MLKKTCILLNPLQNPFVLKIKKLTCIKIFACYTIVKIKILPNIELMSMLYKLILTIIIINS